MGGLNQDVGHSGDVLIDRETQVGTVGQVLDELSGYGKLGDISEKDSGLIKSYKENLSAVEVPSRNLCKLSNRV